VAENQQINEIQKQGLEKMEALLRQSAMGIHVLFENADIVSAMKDGPQGKDMLDFNKMKKVQDAMTELIAKRSYYDKISFLKDLDKESYKMLIRTYFHIVENSIRQKKDQH
jgi:hypothetical protein